MKKLTSILAAAAIAAPVWAASLGVGGSSVIAPSGACHPVMSTDGGKVLYSTGDYHGLWIANLATGETAQISDAVASGFAPRFTADGSGVVYRTESRVDFLRMKNVMSYDIATAGNTELAPMSRATANLASYAAPQLTQARGNYREIVVTANGIERRISPIEGAYSYLWVSLSPNAQRILFVEAHTGMHICNLDGSGLISLGRGSYPSWLSDEWVLFTSSTHDGEHITASQIMAVEVATGNVSEITAADSMTEEASGSIDAGKIAVSDTDGQLTLIDIYLID